MGGQDRRILSGMNETTIGGKMSNYVPYHVHTQYSLLDSSTKFEDYVDKAKSYGIKAICFSEHGNVFGWYKKLKYCHDNGIKYLYGIECYLTETTDPDKKIRDNYHTILIAKNMNGFLELNELISSSYQQDHFYYKPRITFDEFLSISDNIIKISACLASPLWSFRKRLDKADEDGYNTTNRRELYLQLAKHYDYLEIQYHDDIEQSTYNKLLYEISKSLNIPLIAGTDTHSLNQYKAECRIVLKYGKTDGDWGDGENKYDLTFKSYDELVECFERQNSLPRDVFLQAIENTNIMADSVDELDIDVSVKYPILYPDKDEESVMWDRIRKMYNEKAATGIVDGTNQQYWQNIETEMAVFKKINMVGFMLFMSELMCWARDQKIYTSPCRGSVGGSTVAYITGIIDLDPVKRHTVFSRFANEYREEVGDIDTDWFEDDRPKIYNHMFDRFGYDKCAYILALGTLADASVIDTIGKAFRIAAEQKGIETEYTLAKIKEIKSEWSNDPNKTRNKYPDLFKYYDGLAGCIVSQSQHPAGIVVAPLNIIENYSIFYKDGAQILPLDMDEVHEVGLVKYDILGLKNVGIISKVCQYSEQPLPTEATINWDDQDVFADMVKNPVGVFQFESEYAHRTLSEYYKNVKAKGLDFTIDDMTLCNACIRPSGASYRDALIALKKHNNPSPMIDNLLNNTHGWLVYQEQVIAFLQEICGLSGGAADNVRRAIGRKQIDRLEAALPEILDGYCNRSDKPRDVAETEAKDFIQVIEDSSSYMFGYNHATGYSMLGYLCAYYRYYYPIEFCTAFLNCSKTDVDIQNGTSLINAYGFKLSPARFGRSRAGYFFDKDSKTIFKSVDSIKNMNASIAEELYQLGVNHYDYFTDLLYDIKEKTSVATDQLEILIKLDFFEEFGDINKLLYVKTRFDNLWKRKSIRRDQLESMVIDVDVMRRFCNKETETRIEEIDVARWAVDHNISVSEIESLKKPKGGYSTKRAVKQYGIDEREQLKYATKIVIGSLSEIDNRGLIRYFEDNSMAPECSVGNKIQYQKEYLGYVEYKNPMLDKRIVLVTNLDTKYSPRFVGYCLNNGKQCDLKIHKKRPWHSESVKTSFNDCPIKDGDIIYMKKCKQEPRRKMVDGQWVTSSEMDWWIKDYYPIDPSTIH